MKKTFTILIAAIAAILMMAMPKMVWGQEKTNSTAGISNANIVAAGNATSGYQSWSITGSNSKTWSAYAIKNYHSNATTSNHYLQIKKYASNTAYYIQIPAYGVKINSITMTVSNTSTTINGGGNTATLYFSNSNSTSATGTGVASGTGASSVTIDCSSLNLNTGYITASAGVRIWNVEISYTPYTITYTATNGSISGVLNGTNPAVNVASGDGVVIGDQVTLTATPSSGYSFNGWSVSGTGSTLSSTSANPTTFTMGTANATVTANFVSGQAYTITALSNNNNYGTVELTGNVITASPAAGYTYANPAYTVTSGTATVEKNGDEFTVTPTSDCTVTINFAAIPTHTATFSVNGNTTSNTFYEGQAITFPANPSAINGKSFVGWYTAEYTNASTAPSFVNTTTATMGNSNITYYAVFAIVTTTYSETENEKTQTLQYDTWTYSGSTTDKTSYRLFHTNSYIESSAFDLSILKQVIVYGGTFGGDDYNSLTIGDGTNVWKNVTVSGNSQTGTNTYTGGTTLSGTKSLRIICNSGTATGTGVRISKVEIFTKKATTTITNYCTTVTATHSVTYYRNYDEYDTETRVFNCDEGTVVTAADADLFEAQTCKTFSAWSTDIDGDGTSYSAGATLTNSIDANIVLYAQWGNSPNRTVTYNVNGNTTAIASETVACGSSVTLPSASLSPLAFLGWATTEGGSVSYKAGANYEPAADVTLYAVFGTSSESDMTITTSTTGVPDTYSSSYAECTISGNKFQIKDLMKSNDNPSRLQFKSGSGSIYNTTDFGKITSIVLTYSSSSNKNIIIKPGTFDGEEYTYGNAINPDVDEQDNDIYTFAFGSNYHYFILNNGSGADYLSSIVINYEISSSVTITNVTGAETIANISEGSCILVQNDGVLTFTGTNTNANNLIIEDGGQLKLTNGTANVQATMKRNVAAWTGTVPDKGDEDNAGWYAIASPVNGLAISSFIPAEPENWNVYRYDEPTAYWNEYRSNNTVAPYLEPFTTLTSGVGYLYRSTVAGLEFKGVLNAGNANGEVSPALSWANTTNANLKGFNLVGNPFSHNISWTDMTKTDIGEGYYLLDEDPDSPTHGKWGAATTGTIAPTQAFLVKAASASASLTIKNNLPAQQGKGEQANHNNIMFSISNGSQSDEAYVLFKEGYGLNKISHRNSEIPMLYVIDNGTNYAVATMPDNTQSFMLGFEAKTTGKYTLSFKANGEFNYLHVIDRMTGEDVDMLLEGEYSFIGSPMDNANRFIVRLGYLPNHDDNGENIFAYQSGSDVVVSGEGELQIFDVMGRMISAQRINGVKAISLSANGVYIFKLNEKTQKIVVR